MMWGRHTAGQVLGYLWHITRHWSNMGYRHLHIHIHFPFRNSFNNAECKTFFNHWHGGYQDDIKEKKQIEFFLEMYSALSVSMHYTSFSYFRIDTRSGNMKRLLTGWSCLLAKIMRITELWRRIGKPRIGSFPLAGASGSGSDTRSWHQPEPEPDTGRWWWLAETLAPGLSLA